MKKKQIGRIALGLGTGAIFGFLLHKGRASEHEAISGQLLFNDASVIKIMATAAAAGSLGTWLLKKKEMTRLTIKPLNTGGVVLGGALFGAGMALLGYCPGTSVAAVGQGHKDALAGVVGMLLGAGAFVRAYPALQPIIKKGELGKQTLPELTGSSPWLWIAGTSAAVAGGAAILESR